MNKEKFARRLIQYALGLVVMALGVVCFKRVEVGIPPITSVPAAVSNITPLSLGTATTLLHALCVIGQVAVIRRVTLKSMLTLLVGVPFGWIIDLLLWVFPASELSLALRTIILIIGLALNGLGVQLIVGCDLMLPAPDALTHAISKVHGRKLSNVKIVADAIYVAIALSIDLIATGKVSSVGIGTILSVLLTGRFIGWFNKLFPKLTMEPMWK